MDIMSHYHIHIIISHNFAHVKWFFGKIVNCKKILSNTVYFFYYLCYNNMYFYSVRSDFDLKIMKISVGDVLELKKPHPCGGKLFDVLRVGSDVRVVCKTCGRDMTLDRVKLEKAIKNIVTSSPEQ